MAVKRNTSKRSSKGKAGDISIKQRIENFRNDEKARFFVGLFMIFFTIFLLIAFSSFLFTWKQDQSVLDANWFTFIFKTDMPVENFAGKLGALFSSLFIYNWFGIASYGILFLSTLLGFRLMKLKLLPLKKTFKLTIIAMFWLSTALAFSLRETNQVLGGNIGFMISQWLMSIFGQIGTGFVLFVTLFAYLIFTIEGFHHSVLRASKNFADKTKISGIFAKAEPKFNFTGDNIQNENQDLKNVKTEKTGRAEVVPPIKNIVIDLDTNQPLETVDRKKFLLNDSGQQKNIDEGLGFEIESTKDKNEQPVISDEDLLDNPKEIKNEDQNGFDDEGLALAVEKNSDILVDEEDFTRLSMEDYDPTLDLSNYKFPPIDLLEDHKAANSEVTNEELISNKNKIVETLKHYKIEITKIKATIGPTITLYEIIPAPGVRISKIKNLEDDIALSLSALGIRIIAPMPGRGTIGIEVPNQKPEIVSMRSVISSAKFQDSGKMDLPIALGKTISNESYVVDLAKMPHLLVAGATGQGKSVGLNAILTSLLYKKHPSQLKFVLVDPKKVELTLYERIEQHFLAALPDSEESIITDNQMVINTVASLNIEMDNRYNLMKRAKVRNIKEYNAKFISRRLNPNNGHKFMPYIVLVIDEFADLIMTAGKEIEFPIARLAQLARAVGIHLIVATQRPSTNIITGIIKANFPTRVAFKVASMIDSRTILDSPGANHLIGRGDMLITQGSDLVRLQCAFIDTPELDKITTFIGDQVGYPMPYLLPEPESTASEIGAVDMSKKDDFFEDAARMVVIHQQGSTSLIQRKLSIGYNRAGRIIDQLEAAGIVGPFKGSKAREVLYTDEYSLDQYLNTMKN